MNQDDIINNFIVVDYGIMYLFKQYLLSNSTFSEQQKDVIISIAKIRFFSKKKKTSTEIQLVKIFIKFV